MNNILKMTSIKKNLININSLPTLHLLTFSLVYVLPFGEFFALMVVPKGNQNLFLTRKKLIKAEREHAVEMYSL